MSENVRSSRTNLWLIGVLCVAPVAASYFAFYFARPDGHINYGELVETRPLPEARLQLADGSAFQFTLDNPNQAFTGQWKLERVEPRPQ